MSFVDKTALKVLWYLVSFVCYILQFRRLVSYNFLSSRSFPREFQRLAVQLLDHCFITDESRSSKLMTYELRNWGNTTNLNLAVTSGHTLFVAHSCNQELLTDIWSGVMTLRTLKSLKVSSLLGLAKKNNFSSIQ